MPKIKIVVVSHKDKRMTRNMRLYPKQYATSLPDPDWWLPLTAHRRHPPHIESKGNTSHQGCAPTKQQQQIVIVWTRGPGKSKSRCPLRGSQASFGLARLLFQSFQIDTSVGVIHYRSLSSNPVIASKFILLHFWNSNAYTVVKVVPIIDREYVNKRSRSL